MGVHGLHVSFKGYALQSRLVVSWVVKRVPTDYHNRFLVANFQSPE